MRFIVLASDYDGTLASDGVVSDSTIAALERMRESGRTLVLVTGRELDDLGRVFPRLDLFDRVVAENGAVLFAPAEHREVVLAPPPPPAFVAALRRRHVKPLAVGHSIISTRHPHETTVLKAIRELGLELKIIFNKGAVMILPSGTTKCTGLAAALAELGLSFHNVVGVGDAENDHAFLRASECAVAVANALPALKKTADWTTVNTGGAGVVELIEHLITDDLRFLEPRLVRHDVVLGTAATRTRRRVMLRSNGTSLLVAGSSSAGKSSLTLGVLERISGQHYQYCLLDPEGDYEAMPNAVRLGTHNQAPAVEEVLDVLQRPDQSVVVCLLAVARADRPTYFTWLLARLEALRATTGRPHWLILDEAHHLLPSDWGALDKVVPHTFGGLIMITVRPRALAPVLLRSVTVVCAVGEDPGRRLRDFCEIVHERPPAAPSEDLEKGQAVVWQRGHRRADRIAVEPARRDRQRHRRKYAEGELPPDRSFYFTGPDARLHLRAHNLSLFVELGDGVDDVTWLHHLRAGHYSRWVRAILKDDTLADRLAQLEDNSTLTPRESRTQVREAIEEGYAPPE
ncbi:MAG: Cof-type HAD-IIB family hydrolase [Chloroflexota bacterium]|nr:Cof-type HAD-IIB family hydrolase [Chloroflexota bacterium]